MKKQLLLKQIASVYKKSLSEVTENSKNEISTFDIKDFNETIEYSDLPNSIQSLLKFPYIENSSQIDSIKYSKENMQILVLFKLTYKHFTQLFYDKANSLNLINSMSLSRKEYLDSTGMYNLRQYCLFKISDEIIESDKKEEPETTEEINEEVEERPFLYSIVNEFGIANNYLKGAVLQIFGDCMDEEAKAEMKKIWTDTKKEIDAGLK